MTSSSDQSSYVPEITGICYAALQMRQRPVFLVMTSSLVPEWDLKGVVSEWGGFCTAGMLPGYSPQWPCAQLFLWQAWSKCNDDKIVHVLFFLHTISSLQWQSHLFPPQAESWWMSRTRLHRHSHRVEYKGRECKCIRNLDQFSLVSEAFCNAVSNGRALHREAHSKDRTSMAVNVTVLCVFCFLSDAC